MRGMEIQFATRTITSTVRRRLKARSGPSRATPSSGVTVTSVISTARRNTTPLASDQMALSRHQPSSAIMVSGTARSNAAGR